MPNRLAGETSPYLLQHANNPVDWFPWGEEAWARARAEDKPVLVSVGYAACHWCHVMERESFENDAIAAIQNDLVVSIKVDREERPDVDEIYMDAQQMLHGHGGWPLNVFCTPDGRPFFGGTYFPPQRRTGMPGWTDVLQGVTRAFREQREQVEQQATQLTQHLNLRVELAGEELTESPAQVRSRAAAALLQSADRTHGGFGGAPKFPQPYYLQLLVQQALDESASNRNDARRHLAHSLRRMAEGGIYDQLAGGFHRYAVDQIWLVPHFEKMLYDNALLNSLYLDGLRLADSPADADLFARIARETADYLLNELQTPDGAFYASTDADSEGVEGKYFVWTRDELHELLEPQDAEIACRRWGVDVGGNWEGNSILLAAQSPEDVARWLDLPLAEVEASLSKSREKLLTHRATRVPPATDTKIIAAWNGMAIDSLARAGAVLEEPRFTDAARRAARFILDRMRTSDGGLLRIHSAGRASVDAFVEDYAALADGMISVYEATGDESWYAEARSMIDAMIDRFWDHDGGGFFTVGRDGEQLIAQRKPVQDGATPSGNSLAARALARIYALTGEGRYADLIEAMHESFSAYLSKAPTMLGLFVSVEDWLTDHRSVALVGPADDSEIAQMRRDLWTGAPRPIVVMQRTADGTQVPQLADKPQQGGQPTAYVCQAFACSAPVHSAEDLRKILSEPLST
ncbi:MAG: thioredoxin domain-containing protein [Chloroflexi bacterium]|nr:thioredoxin domain-containing protein [Chloroflexota bacterium]MYB23426.1 thioredoxin domain-containing protein [Chloroflexota bacterium]MYF22380.1 thioredoxin domain-containing protein [Chloroflexota bacterium]MYI03940.1 thioredoxin domain-containing protein [Chloroflexota bacterium]